MEDNPLVLLPHFEAKTHKVTLAAVDVTAPDFSVVEHITGVEIAKPHPPGMIVHWQHDSTAVIEIEAQATRTFLRKQLSNRAFGLGLWIRWQSVGSCERPR
jgi:hypothetical protein